MPQTTENLGPAETIINTLIAHGDHLFHNRTGIVRSNPSSVTGVTWSRALWKEEDGAKVVYELRLVGKKSMRTRIGVLGHHDIVMDGTSAAGYFMRSGMFTEVAVWMYRQVVAVWKMDNEFAARWASYAFAQEHRDLKVVMAAFLLVQSRRGDAVMDGGKIAFHDEDYRDVGEAMILLDGKSHLDLKMLLRVRALLRLPEIAAINRELGFTGSTRRAYLGRFDRAAEKWLRYREDNPKMLQGLIKKGFSSSLLELAQAIRYKPSSPRFFQLLRWKQDQAETGHRTIAIGEAVASADSWVGLTEEQICERIVAQKPDMKRLVGMVPADVGLTRAIMAAAVEVGSLSNKDLIIYTPTLEELGLLKVPEVQAKWQAALKAAEDQRAANIASRVKSTEVQAQLQEASDDAAKKTVEEVTRNMRIYVFVDISGSMEHSIVTAKAYVSKLLVAVPADKLHVAVFNTFGKEIEIKHTSTAGVENAFRGISAGGGTAHGSGVMALRNRKPADDEDALFIFVGDEGEYGSFAGQVRSSGLNPVAIGLVSVLAPGQGRGHAVRTTAIDLGVPCFEIDESVFADPYAVPRILRNLIAATPVNVVTRPVAAPRVSLVDVIAKTSLLQKPHWAA